MPLPRSVLRMTDQELDAFLSSERTMRVATVSPDGSPHVAPLWFVWLDGAIWCTSLRRSRRSKDLASGSKAAACIDAGHEYAELRGATLYGTFEEATDHPDIGAARRAMGQKYWNIEEVPDLKSHVWLRMVPERIASWDFAKIPSGKDRKMRSVESVRDGED